MYVLSVSGVMKREQLNWKICVGKSTRPTLYKFRGLCLPGTSVCWASQLWLEIDALHSSNIYIHEKKKKKKLFLK